MLTYRLHPLTLLHLLAPLFMEYLQLACPYCAGQFSAAAGTESRTTACPHCQREVAVPAVPPPPPPPASFPAQPAPAHPPIEVSSGHVARPEVAAAQADNPPAEGPPVRRRSPQELARLRRRLNFALAAIGMTILAVVLLVLVRLRP